MKKKIILVLDIIVMIFCVGIIVYEAFLSEKMNIRLMMKAAVLFMAFALALLGIRPKRSLLDKKLYAQEYKEIIRGAFKSDKSSYNKLMSAISDYNSDRNMRAVKKLDKLFETACAEPDDYSAVLIFKARCYEDNGLTGTAIETYEELLRYNSADPVAWYSLGAAYNKDGDISSAENAYLNSISYDPSNPLPYNNMAVICHRRGDTQNALSYALRALELKPGMYQPMSTAAICYRIFGDTETSEKYFLMYSANGGDANALKEVLDNTPIGKGEQSKV